MASDVIATRARFGKNPQAPGISADVLASKNDTDGRLVMQFNGFGVSVDGPYIGIGHARGTVDAPANNVDGDNLGDYEFYAYAGGWRQAAEIRAYVTGVVVDGTTPATGLQFNVAAAGGTLTPRFYIFSTGRLGVGSASRATETDAAANGAGAMWVAENSNRQAIAFQYTGDNANAAQILGRRNRGASLSAPTTVQNGDAIAEFRAQAYTGSWQNGGYIEFVVDAAPVANQAAATRIGFFVNTTNAAPVEGLRIRSDRVFVMGVSMTNFVDGKFNYNLAGGVEEVAATYGQAGGFPNSMVFGYSTYSSGYTNGHPARMYVGDNNFSCYIRWDHKKTGAASNTMVPSLLLTAAANAANVAFFDNSGSFGNGQGVIFIANRNTAPTANPTGGGILYAEGGALKWRGSAGTVTTIANA